ncbi:MAG TPA: DUF305 domain-containing protein [Gemmatimonadaceae bacterium]|jgi:uncharacterized protein (DUF305 family)|nr:DUF305 domain-containing protein [Gemmatimonadaceae bacterium]
MRARWLALVMLQVTPFAAHGRLAAQTAPDTTDVQFMQGMIAHHAQALAMVALIPDRTTRPELQAIGLRIKISQQDEIAFMQRWLKDRHQVVPTIDANNVAHMPAMSMPGMQMADGVMMMPGMMTPAQMTALAAAHGAAFDRLFLEGMIRHHEGALTMVKNLLATTGAAQAPEVFTFASDADADQRAEIKRMRSVLDAISSSSLR